MSAELTIFFGSAGASITAGLIVRLLALEHNQTVDLALFDFTKDLFAAAAAVFPTVLVIQSKTDAVKFSGAQFLGTLMLIVVIALWAKGDTRYFAYWRDGKRRTKGPDGKLGPPTAAGSPRRSKMLAFAVGNGLGFTVLFFSTVLAQGVAS